MMRMLSGLFWGVLVACGAESPDEIQGLDSLVHDEDVEAAESEDPMPSPDAESMNSPQTPNPEQMPSPEPTMVPNLAPDPDDADFQVEIGMAFTGRLAALDAEGAAVTFALVDMPANGTLSGFAAESGAFTYLPSIVTPGIDSFSFTVSDGTNVSSPKTVTIGIVPVNYTGTWQLTDSTCTGDALSLKHFANRLSISSHYYRCGSTTVTADSVNFDVRSGRLFIEGSPVGTMTAEGFSYTRTRFISGCGNVSLSFQMKVSGTGEASYSESTTSPCAGSTAVSGTRVRATTPDPVELRTFDAPQLTYSPAWYTLGNVSFRKAKDVTVTLNNIGSGTAQMLSVAATSALLTFKGGSFPGTGGTCGAELAPGKTCTVVFDLDTDRVGYYSGAIVAAYFDGIQTLTKQAAVDFTVPPPATNPIALSAFFDRTCILDASGVLCWRRGEKPDVIPTLTQPTAVATGQTFACALADQELVCWGSNLYGELNLPTLSHPRQISLGTNYGCALDDTGVHCWGGNGNHTTEVPPLTNPRAISAGTYQVCALDDSGVLCWGQPWDGATIPPALTNPRAIAAGRSGSCALDDEGAKCWGFDYQGRVSNAPATASSMQVLTSGDSHACGVLANGSMMCWGRALSATAPQGTIFSTSPGAIAAGSEHTCGIALAQVLCWGKY